MLDAMEDTLARVGIEELLLNVSIANTPGRRLDAAAGYELVGEDARVSRMRKHLERPPGWR